MTPKPISSQASSSTAASQASQQALRRPPRLLHRPFKGNCERCGHEYIVERGGHFSDASYYELFHDYMNLEARYKAAVRFLCAVLRARNDPSNPANAQK